MIGENDVKYHKNYSKNEFAQVGLKEIPLRVLLLVCRLKGKLIAAFVFQVLTS